MPTAPRQHLQRPAEAGVSIVLVLFLLLLLVVLVFRVDFAAHVEGDAALHHVQETQMRYLAEAALLQAQSALLLDLEEASEQAGEGGGDEGEGDEDDPFGGGGGEIGQDAMENAAQVTAATDSLLDEWANSAAILPPMGDDWEVFVEIEDEDAKINLLGIWAEDEERREEWRDVLRRLLDEAFEGTSLDLSALDAEDILSDLDEWARGERGNRPAVPVPPRKRSQAEDDAEEQELDTDIIDTEEVHFPLTLHELAFFESLLPEHLMGFVEDDEHYPGLESYLTLWSHLELKDPIDPDEDAFSSSPFGSDDSDDEADDDEEETDEPDITAEPTFDGRVNVNRASLKVLRALAPEDIPTTFLEAVVEFRERVLEESSTIQEQRFNDRRDAADPDSASMFDDPPELSDDEEEDPTRFVFQTPAEVFDKVEEEMDLSVFTDDEEKRRFEARLGVESQVFTVKILISEPQDPQFPDRPVTTRSFRAVFWRADTSDGPMIIPLLPLEAYRDSRRVPEDLGRDPDDLAEAARAFR